MKGTNMAITPADIESMTFSAAKKNGYNTEKEFVLDCMQENTTKVRNIIRVLEYPFRRYPKYAS